MAHVSVMVPDGHTIQIHPPGGPMPPMAQGMVPSAIPDGMKAAMDSALPAPEPKPKKKAVAEAARKGAGSESGKVKASGAKLSSTKD